MTPDERARIIVTARLLRAAATIDWLSTGLTLLGAVALAAGLHGPVAAAATVAIGVVAKVYGVRIAFDARLLEDVAADRLSTSDLDAALGAMKLAPPDKAGRPWLDRCRGAMRLVRYCALATAAQCVAIILVGLEGR